MRAEYRSTFLSRNARFLWLLALFLTPAVVLLAYDLTPHNNFWQQILFSLLCLPLLVAFVVALIGSLLAILMHHIVTDF